MIGIRADANDTVASGHIMRCITIAVQLQKRGEKVVFFTADGYAAKLLKAAGMESVCLHSSWREPEKELPALKAELEVRGCEKLLVDTYEATVFYLEELGRICKIIYIDDMFEAVYPADLLINYNAYHTRFPYESVYGKRTRLLLGTAYVPLREEFSLVAGRESSGSVKRILLSCGGGDVHNALCGILEAAVNREKLKGMVFHTVVGGFNKNAAQLARLAGRYPNIVLHHRVHNMARLMGECELAVSAAGTVLFELCAMQVPSVFFVCADNQRYDREFFEKDNRMLFAGDIRSDREKCISSLCGGLERLAEDTVLYKEMQTKQHEVTDGKGAGRIAEEIIRL